MSFEQSKESNKKLDKILSKIQTIDERLDLLFAKMEHMDKQGEKLDSHIDFIETVYDTVRHPMSTVISMISTTKLPEITES
jgi:uncharacterized protein YaaN involved in tellurite resistance